MLNQKAIENIINTLEAMFPNNPQLKKAKQVLTALPQVYENAEKKQTGNLQTDINNALNEFKVNKNQVINSIEIFKQNPFVNIVSKMLGVNINDLENVYKNQSNSENNNNLNRFR